MLQPEHQTTMQLPHPLIHSPTHYTQHHHLQMLQPEHQTTVELEATANDDALFHSVGGVGVSVSVGDGGVVLVVLEAAAN